MNKRKRLAGCIVTVAAALALGFLVGGAASRDASARAGVRRSAPPQAFLSGSERALPVLMEISTTLKRIDQRLARIERAVAGQGKP
ncbi:MAG TPA: hypothetical protein EYH34_02105 [Planctomycetes bacterium]|nr:hypothetical protein [Planctomycetota bacterium]